jgi:hypothetical protein
MVSKAGQDHKAASRHPEVRMAVRRDKEEQWRYRIVVKLPDGQKERISGTPTLNTKVECERTERDHVFRTLHPASVPAETKEVRPLRSS